MLTYGVGFDLQVVRKILLACLGHFLFFSDFYYYY